MALRFRMVKLLHFDFGELVAPFSVFRQTGLAAKVTAWEAATGVGGSGSLQASGLPPPRPDPKCYPDPK